MAETFIFTYQAINQINGKRYIGVHKTEDINDGYIGCGVCHDSDAVSGRNYVFHNAVKKYGYASFRRYTLSFFDKLNNLIAEHESLRSAAKFIGCSNPLVQKHLKGDIQSCKGFILKYKEVGIGR